MYAQVPEGFKVTATYFNMPCQRQWNALKRNFYATQFHPEVNAYTVDGMDYA